MDTLIDSFSAGKTEILDSECWPQRKGRQYIPARRRRYRASLGWPGTVGDQDDPRAGHTLSFMLESVNHTGTFNLSIAFLYNIYFSCILCVFIRLYPFLMLSDSELMGEIAQMRVKKAERNIWEAQG